MKAVVISGLALLLATFGPGIPPDPTFAPVDWWYDATTRALCWDGRTDRPLLFFVDLDGVHDTAVTNDWWNGTGGLFVAPLVAVSRGATSIAGRDGQTEAQWGETRINPPLLPHVRHPQNTQFPQEWYHLFVTRLEPPSDFVIGIQGSDGTRVRPIDGPFWVSEDFGMSYQEFTPESAPSGSCVEAALSANVDFDPDTLNPRSRGKWVTVYIELPSGYDPADVNAATILLNDVLVPVLDPKYGFVSDPSGYLVDHDGDGVLERMVKFDRARVIEILPPGTNPVRITGQLFDGTAFSGVSDPVRVLG